MKSAVVALLVSLVLAGGCGRDRRNNGTPDGGGADDLGAWILDDAGNVVPVDGATPPDGATSPDAAYGNLDPTSGQCGPGQTPSECPNALADDVGCGASEQCGDTGRGNGLDDDCDGQVDEICGCTPGDVQRCFLGPPGKHGIGGCTDGSQTCAGSEFGFWGPCTGSISPAPEGCDGVDNDCDGCVDDGLCCGTALACPTSVPDVLPFASASYPGGTYFSGAASTWTWTVTGGPCDQLFAQNGSPQSFSVTGGDTADASVHYNLSGDYTVTMQVTTPSGETASCTFVQHVAGPGVRVELCWDKTGQQGSDLDLHLHRPNSTTNWFGTKVGMNRIPTIDDCYFANCGPITAVPRADWGYAASPASACSGGPMGGQWGGTCPNPRLDSDNVNKRGKPENINVDRPVNGDRFRVLVHYYDVNSATGIAGSMLTVHPLVNVYCGGRLKTTYGQAPDVVPDFTTAGQWANGDMWRVADVTAIVDAMGNTTDCTVDALHPIGATSGYRVGHDGKITYDGN